MRGVARCMHGAVRACVVQCVHGAVRGVVSGDATVNTHYSGCNRVHHRLQPCASRRISTLLGMSVSMRIRRQTGAAAHGYGGGDGAALHDNQGLWLVRVPSRLAMWGQLSLTDPQGHDNRDAPP